MGGATTIVAYPVGAPMAPKKKTTGAQEVKTFKLTSEVTPGQYHGNTSERPSGR